MLSYMYAEVKERTAKRTAAKLIEETFIKRSFLIFYQKSVFFFVILIDLFTFFPFYPSTNCYERLTITINICLVSNVLRLNEREGE